MSVWKTLSINFWLVRNMSSSNQTKKFKSFCVFIFLSTHPHQQSAQSCVHNLGQFDLVSLLNEDSH